jgi:hypothetical protein
LGRREVLIGKALAGEVETGGEENLTFIRVLDIGNPMLFRKFFRSSSVSGRNGLDDDFWVRQGRSYESQRPVISRSERDDIGLDGRTYAILAAPRIPNLTAPSFFSALGGSKDVKTRFSRVNIVESARVRQQDGFQRTLISNAALAMLY